MEGMILFVMTAFISSFISCATFLTQDDTHLKLNKIEMMVKKCENNGGLEFIEHDYDVKCKNGAEFINDRTKE